MKVSVLTDAELERYEKLAAVGRRSLIARVRALLARWLPVRIEVGDE